MSTSILTLFFAASLVCLLPHISAAQHSEAPVHKDGDWWKVKVEVVYKGVTRTGRCDEYFPEYLVKIDQGKPKIYAVKGDTEQEIICPRVEEELLGSAGMRQLLKFPLTVGLNFSFPYQAQSGVTGKLRWVNVEVKVLSWEKIKTPKGEFDAFKIERRYPGGGGEENVETYFYAPKVKAIVSFSQRTQVSERDVALVDFNVSQ